MNCPVTPVAVGILVNAAGYILMSTRPPSKSYSGYWEFPGGKIKPNESPIDALRREIKEEISVCVSSQKLLFSEVFTNAKTAVHLHFFLIKAWEGELFATEGQQLSWQNPRNINVFPVLEANLNILAKLATELSYDK